MINTTSRCPRPRTELTQNFDFRKLPSFHSNNDFLGEVLMFGSYGAGDLDPKALNKLIGNQCLRPLYCTLGTGSCKP